MRCALLALVCALIPALVHAQPAITRFTTATGARVLVRPETDADTVAICVFIGAGVPEESSFPSGTGAVVARALFGGNDNQSAEEVNHSIFDVGGSLESLWKPDYTLFTCVTSRHAFSDAFYLICQALKSAKLDEAAVARARREIAAEAEKDAADPFEVAGVAVRARLYADSPYAGAWGGTPATLRRVTPEVAARFFYRWYTPGNTVISIAGDISVDTVREDAGNYLVDYNRRDARHLPYAPSTVNTVDSHAVRTLPVHTSTLVAAFPAPGIRDADYPAFSVLTALAGGGKSARLFRRVRDTAGIGYVVGATTPPLARESQLLAFLEFDPSRAGAKIDSAGAEKLVLDTVRSIVATPPAAREIERARNFAIGSYALAHQRVRERAFYPGWYEMIGAGHTFDAELPAKLAAVTTADIQRVAAKYLRTSAAAIVEPDNHGR